MELRFETEAPDPACFGNVLEKNGSGKLWQAVLQDPREEALQQLRQTAGIHDIDVSPLHLEEIYCALLSRKEAQP